jgi:hypothetical protein
MLSRVCWSWLVIYDNWPTCNLLRQTIVEYHVKQGFMDMNATLATVIDVVEHATFVHKLAE